jgi:hypothetical protein
MYTKDVGESPASVNGRINKENVREIDGSHQHCVLI